MDYMSKLVDLQTQIDKLQKQASELRAKEFDVTVNEIKKLMSAYGITAKDLQDAKGKAKKLKTYKSDAKATNVKKVKVPVPAKYVGPNGETWTGRGIAPKWLSALIENGQSKETFLIQPKDGLNNPPPLEVAGH
jgi:DNA-binding protein H-NS